jgi:hypothetical protein
MCILRTHVLFTLFVFVLQTNTNNVNKTCVLNIHIIRHHYIQTNTNNVNKTCVLNIHIIRHHYIQTNTNNVNCLIYVICVCLYIVVSYYVYIEDTCLIYVICVCLYRVVSYYVYIEDTCLIRHVSSIYTE